MANAKPMKNENVSNKTALNPDPTPHEIVGHRCAKCDTKVYLPAGEKFVCCTTAKKTAPKKDEPKADEDS